MKEPGRPQLAYGGGRRQLRYGPAAIRETTDSARWIVAGLLIDSDQPEVLADWHFAGCRLATYADLMTPQLVANFAGRLVVIDRGMGDPMNLATVADIEAGALSVDQGAARIRQWIKEGRPSVTAYHDRADWPAVDQATAGTHCFNWLATLDGTADPAGKYPAAVQIEGSAALGMHVDLSIVWQDWWHPLAISPGPAQIAALRRLWASAEGALAQVAQAVAGL